MAEDKRALTVGAVKESYPDERRVAIVPDVVAALGKKSIKTLIESGAGQAAGYEDESFRAKGAEIASSRADVFKQADVIAQVRGLGANAQAGKADLPLLRKGQIVVGFLEPLGEPSACSELAKTGVTAFSLELLPRITRAQSMDVLSSMATVAGYKAVLIAASTLPRMFPLLMTAAGTVAPARVLVIGAGVAGLQAIATAHRLGAVVSSYDVRPAVKEQVESLGAKFVELPLETGASETKGGYAKAMDEEFYRKQRELMAKVASESDVVITTAAVPGKKAPILLTADMVRQMHPGSLIVDLAAERGGNCELTKPGETIVAHGVTITGPLNLASTVPYHASQMYAKNIQTFLLHLIKDGAVQLNMDDEITRDTLVTRDGEVVHPQVRELLGLKAANAA
jgi:NAD(P) transhydrogenase subunit alpha